MPRTKPTRRSPAKIRKTLSDLEASGLSRAKFATQNGIPISTIHSWMKKAKAKKKLEFPTVISVGTLPAPPVPPLIEVELPGGEVLRFGPGTKVFLVAGPTDMRKSFDTLAAVVRGTINDDPLSGHLFVFCNRRRDRLKALIWEDSGFWLLAKCLEQGTFVWPDQSRIKVRYSSVELAVLLAGLELSGRRRHRRSTPADRR